MALHLAGTDYDHREVLLRDKPATMLDASPKGTVPVFILVNGEVIDESLDLMRWALPDEPIDTSVTDMIDGPFKHHLDRYKYRSRYEETAKRGDVDLSHRAQAIELLQSLETCLMQSEYLMGSERSLTDIASFPFIRQFAATEPDWWARQSELPKTRNWLAELIASDLFKTIMVKHPLWVEPS